jgi:D-3-phosphoglycerate dehydrogenase / 2-oxoglutarate reductase
LAERPKVVVLEPFRSKKAADRLAEGFSVRSIKKLSDLKKVEPGVRALFARLAYRIDGPFLDRFPGVRFVATPATGLVHIDSDACAIRGVTVVSLKGERAFLDNLTATAELAWGHIMAFHRHLPYAMGSVLKGVWDRDLFIGNEVKGKTLGIIGLGRLGTMVAQYATAFRMRVIYSDPQDAGLDYAERVTQDQLLAQSDVISLHLHVSDETRGMLGRSEFSKMKRKPLLVNTSRGELIDEAALLSALKTGKIRGACLDVLAGEHWNTPAEKKAWFKKNELIAYARKNKNLLLTPHMGGLTWEGIEQAELFTVEKLLAAS